jgi:replicative DNA helicase
MAAKREEKYIAIDISGREPPHNADAEIAVIGTVLYEGKKVEDCGDVAPEEFYSDTWRRTWRAIQALRARGSFIDPQTVANELRATEQLQAVGGLSALMKTADTTPAVGDVGAYAAIVRAHAFARRVIETAQVIAAEGLARAYAPLDFVDWASRRFEEVVSGGPRKHGIERIGLVGKWRVLQYQQQWAGEREAFGLRTQWHRLNGLVRGRSLGCLRFVGGFTSSGKSSYCEEEALFISGKPYQFPRKDDPDRSEICDAATLYLTLEMPKVSVYDRAVVQLARVSLDELTTGKDDATGEPLDGDKRAAIDRAVKQLDTMPFFFDDADQRLESIIQAVRIAQSQCRAMTAARMREKAALDANGEDSSHIRPVRLAMVYLDHFHITDENDEKEIVSALARLAKGLKRLSVNEMIHLCALVQFNRDAPKRGERDADSLPQIFDIKFGSSIEQAADDIELIHRKWLSIQDKASPEAQECREDAVVIRGKGRNGRLGLIRMRFVGEHYHFEEKES